MCTTTANSETGVKSDEQSAHRCPLSHNLWENQGTLPTMVRILTNSETGTVTSRNGNSSFTNCPFGNCSL